jgi:hypothetical protein
MEDGWRPVAIEWVRQAKGAEMGPAPKGLKQEVPYGLKVSEDCLYLEEDPREKAALNLMLALIAGDHPLSKIATELNRQELFKRNGDPWSQVAVFNMLPRLIEVAPGILTADEWSTSRDRILRAV